jgi:hypothetical protein
MSLKLCKVSLFAGDEANQIVLVEENIPAMREQGFRIEEMDDQGMMSVIALRQVNQITGHQIILKSGESVVNMLISPTEVTVVLSVVASRERSMFIEITGIGTRLYQFKSNENDGKWSVTQPITVWAEDFKTQLYRTGGRSVTPTEYVEALWYARECYRPGTSAQPMDSFERTMDGFASPGAERNWKVSAPKVGTNGQVAYEAGQYVGEE